MSYIVRTLDEAEIETAVEFLSSNVSFAVSNHEAQSEILKKRRQDTERFYRSAFFLHKDLIVGAFENKNLLGVAFGIGHGDVVSIDQLVVRNGEKDKTLARELVEAIERAAKRYGYLRIYLAGDPMFGGFFESIGFSPQVLLTFSDKRAEMFQALSSVYPTWIEAGAENVKVLLGTNIMEPELESAVMKFGVNKSDLYLKML